LINKKYTDKVYMIKQLTKVSLHSLLFCIAVLAIFSLYFNHRETFIPHGLYPKSVTTPLLSGVYPLKVPGTLSHYTYESQSELYPKWAVGNYKQETNNKKNWESPCNGTASPADMCGGLYKKTKVVEQECMPAPPASNCLRVNYFCSL
jgi:hypothetical protein